MSQMVSRRQAIYRLVCMLDVTSSVSVVHQSPATPQSLTPGSEHSTMPESFRLPLCGCLHMHNFSPVSFYFQLAVGRAADVQPCSAYIKSPPAGFFSSDAVQTEHERRSLLD